MHYANTLTLDGIETVLTVLPLSAVPGFDPENPHPNTYAVPDEVQVGWVRRPDGSFTPPPAPTPEELAAQADALRATAYRNEADPLYFKAQRGEATEEQWLAKIAEIKARYPKPE